MRFTFCAESIFVQKFFPLLEPFAAITLILSVAPPYGGTTHIVQLFSAHYYGIVSRIMALG